MKAIFNYKGHGIALERTLAGATLSVDGVPCGEMKDGMKALLGSILSVYGQEE